MARKFHLFFLLGLVLLASFCITVAAQEEGDAAIQGDSQSSSEPVPEAKEEVITEKEEVTKEAAEERDKQNKEEDPSVGNEQEDKEEEDDDDSDDEGEVVNPDPECVKPLKFAFEGDCKEAGLESLLVADTETGRAYLEDIDKTALSKWQESADARHIVQLEKCKAPYIRHLCSSNVTLCQKQKKVKVCFSTCVELGMACYGLSLQNALRRCRLSGNYAPKGDEECLHEVKLNLRHIKWEDI